MKVRATFFTLLLTLVIGTSYSAMAAQPDTKDSVGFNIKDEVTVKCTPVKDQYRSGTCWSYSGLGFFECELLRMGKGPFDLSEMFVVRNVYHDKAVNYVRFHGTVEFAGGGSFKDVMDVLEHKGIVPESAYRGLNYGEPKHVHGELDAVLRAYVDAIIRNPNRRLSTAWLRGFDGILDAYLGKYPEKFNYKGVEYTPKSFMKMLGLNMNDYINITSFTHHPFYKPCILEVPDNWARATDQNVPLDELIQIIDNSLKNGYAVGWGSDVSEHGFYYRKLGVAIVPVDSVEETANSEIGKWTKLSKEEKEKRLKDVNGPVPELKVTQEMRQRGFDDWESTDDHGMLIVGIAHDQNGTKYYKVKNSWSTSGVYNGYFYASESFVRYKTMDIMVNKKAIPSAIARKMGLK